MVLPHVLDAQEEHGLAQQADVEVQAVSAEPRTDLRPTSILPEHAEPDLLGGPERRSVHVALVVVEHRAVLRAHRPLVDREPGQALAEQVAGVAVRELRTPALLRCPVVVHVHVHQSDGAGAYAVYHEEVLVLRHLDRQPAFEHGPGREVLIGQVERHGSSALREPGERQREARRTDVAQGLNLALEARWRRNQLDHCQGEGLDSRLVLGLFSHGRRDREPDCQAEPQCAVESPHLDLLFQVHLLACAPVNRRQYFNFSQLSTLL